MKLYQYVVRRLIFTVPKLFIASIVIFAMIHLAPGSPIDVLAPSRATQAQKAAIAAKWGLNEPIYIQYFSWITNVLQGDLGTSFKTREPVLDMISWRLPISLKFTMLGLAISYIIAIPVGVISAIKQHSVVDYFSMGFVLLAVSFPSFWFGIIFIMIFAIQLQWTPATGHGTLGLLLMPAFAIGLRWSGIDARVMRSSMLEVKNQEYIRNLRANGVSEARVLLKHGLRNAIIPIITLFGLRLGWVIAAGFVLEIVFARPGVGNLLITGVFSRDYPVVQGIMLILVTTMMLGNLLADALYGIVDPRIRYE